ncbi:MAG TPA: hypothetical protein VMG12_29315 [Polyangiaceae bacterium]|nr:hypothetical protein [Polyangiaceae bacterium]
MAASRARLEALLARVQQRATEPRSPSEAVAPILEAVNGASAANVSSAANGRARTISEVVPASSAASAEAPASVRAPALPQNLVAHSIPQNEVGDEDIEEYDDELIEIIDDAEVIPQAVAAARAIEPAAFGAAIDRRPTAPIRPEPSRSEPPSVRSAPARQAAESVALRPESVAARPIATTDVARSRGVRRELRHTSFAELLDASLKLG